MKTYVKPEKHEDYDFTYPCLAVNDNNMIVLFIKRGCGTVVFGGKEHQYSLGDIVKSLNMMFYKPFRGKVILDGNE